MPLPTDLAAMPTDPGGLATAVAGLVGGGPAAGDLAAAQADLFDGSPLLGSAAVAGQRRGRPAGAQNRTTKEWAAFILQHYRSPLLALADIISADPFELHAAIVRADIAANLERSVSVKAVIDLQRAAATDLARYVHRQQPVAVDLGEENPLPTINFVVGAAVGGAIGGVLAEALAAQGAQIEGPVADDGEVAGVEVAGGGDGG